MRAILVLVLTAGLAIAGSTGPVDARARRADLASIFSNTADDPSADEAALWQMADKAERHVKASQERVRVKALTLYVEHVACRLAPEHCSDLRLYVLRRPVLNAAAAPNGYVEVNTGLLLRARSEDELAFVLGHEIGHFTQKHALAEYRQHRAAMGQSAMAGAGIAMVAAVLKGGRRRGHTRDITDAAETATGLAYLAELSTVYGFSRAEETEADRVGFDRAAAAGYRPQASVDLWNEVVAETRASDQPTVRNSEARASAFNTHPLTADRIAALTAAIRSRPAASADSAADAAGARQYRAVIRPLLDGWLQDELARRDFGQMLYLLDGLATEGEDLGLIAYYRGETLRQRNHDGDFSRAMSCYRDATSQPDAPAAALRQLGVLSRQTGDLTMARAALTAYLQKAPDATDRPFVEDLLRGLAATTTTTPGPVQPTRP